MLDSQNADRWIPHQKQIEALERLEFEILFGGARGPGKTEALINWFLYDAHHPKFKGLVIRRNSEDLSDYVQRANVIYSRLGGVMSGNPPRFKFPTGGIIRTGHLKDINAFTKYLGHEYHRVGIEELTLIPFEDDYLKLISSCRSTIADLKPQVFSTTNPGGPGHSWVKSRFVDNGSGKTFIDPETGRSRIFISATIDDNPTLMDADPEYVRFLDGLKNKDPNLYKAWRLGLWDIFAGQAFSMLSRDRHIIEPTEIPLPKYFAGYDYGYAHPFAFVLLSVDGNGHLHVVDYVSKTRCEVEEQGKLINELIGDKSMTVYSGVDIWNKEGGPTIVSRLRNTCPKLNFVRANTNRVQGVAELRKWISNDRLKFFSNTTPVFEQLLTVQHDPKKPEDVLKMNADDNGDNGDDIFDALRYAVLTWIYPNKAEEKILPNTKEDMLQWIEKRAKLRKLAYDVS